MPYGRRADPPEDTFGSLAPRLSEIGGELLCARCDEHPPFIEQAEQGVTYAEKIVRRGSPARSAQPAAELERVVRALHPHIGARVALADGTLLGVHRAKLIDAQPAGERRGRAAAGGGGSARASSLVTGACCSLPPGVLELIEVQPPGGRAMDAAAYLRGHGPPGRR